MEIKTTERIANYWDNTLQADIDKVMAEKWVKVDDIEQYFIRLSNQGHTPKMSIQIFLKEISGNNA